MTASPSCTPVEAARSQFTRWYINAIQRRGIAMSEGALNTKEGLISCL